MTIVKMRVENQCCDVRLTDSELREWNDDPYGFTVRKDSVVATCGVKHLWESHASQKCFMRFLRNGSDYTPANAVAPSTEPEK